MISQTQASSCQNNLNGNSNKSNQEEDNGIVFKDWNCKLDKLFGIALQFYKLNESKVFHPSFELRNKMNALICQAKFGDITKANVPDLGVLDLVGKSRRHEWFLLIGMSKSEAMSNFICTLDEICHLFKAHVEAVKLVGNHFQGDTSSENKQTQRKNSNDHVLKNIYNSLCKQTYSQFKNYAEQQYPDDKDKQKDLIEQLQEQYYQQYISQLDTDEDDSNKVDSDSSKFNMDKPVLDVSNLTTDSVDGPPPPFPYNECLVEKEQKNNSWNNNKETVLKESLQMDLKASVQTNNNLDINPNTLTEVPIFSDIESESVAQCFSSQSTYYNDNTLVVIPSTSTLHTPESAAIITSTNNESCESQSNTSNYVCAEPCNYDVIESANMWTKKGVEEFRVECQVSHLTVSLPSDDKYKGMLIVKSSSVMIIRVPTCSNGRYLYWEFASEDYDVGFGVLFEMTSIMQDELELEIYEDSDSDSEVDEHEHVASGDQEAGFDSDNNCGSSKYNRLVTIVPTYRRDSHEDVIVGRHKYPGRGYYLLRFDNTYSVFRSKTIYYRICHLI